MTVASLAYHFSVRFARTDHTASTDSIQPVSTSAGHRNGVQVRKTRRVQRAQRLQRERRVTVGGEPRTAERSEEQRRCAHDPTLTLDVFECAACDRMPGVLTVCRLLCAVLGAEGCRCSSRRGGRCSLRDWERRAEALDNNFFSNRCTDHDQPIFSSNNMDGGMYATHEHQNRRAQQ